MKLESDVVVAFPLALVFRTYRDRMVDLVPYLPNLKSIRMLERRDVPEGVHATSEWIAGADLPKVVQSVVKESMLRWTDHATWLDAEHAVQWRTEVHAFPGAVACGGKNRFVDLGGSTRVEIRGELLVDASKVPGVPRLFASTVAETAEKIIVSNVATNLTAVARGVEQLLRAEATA